MLWFLHGCGLFYFPAPTSHGHYSSPGRAAEEDLKALFLNMHGTTVCSAIGTRNAAYASGEYFLLDADQTSFDAIRRMLVKFAGCTTEPYHFDRDAHFQRLKQWGDDAFPMPLEDIIGKNQEYMNMSATQRSSQLKMLQDLAEESDKQSRELCG